MLKRPYQVALLCIVVFAVYYMTIFNELCVVDDFSVITDLISAKAIKVKEIFFPGSAEGGYYRPFIGLSYLLNLRLWDMNLQTLHIDNILLHVANACLVFFLTLLLLPQQKRERTTLPLVAGVLFGLHPIATESVNWISGRTDLIAGFFVLIAAILVVFFRQTGSKYALVGAACSIMFGVLGKETSLAFLPGAFFLVVATKLGADRASSKILYRPTFKDITWWVALIGVTILVEVTFFNFWIVFISVPLFIFILYNRKRGDATKTSLHFILRPFVTGALITGLAVGIFFIIRNIVFTSNIAKIPQTIKLMGQDPNHTLMVFLQGIGFYVKKFFFPLPLNFAIREIDPLYSLLGTIFVFFGVFLAARRTVPSALALAGGFLFAPALPLAFGTIAWTAYAERYIYISTAFWTIAGLLSLAPYLEKLGKRYVQSVAGVLIIVLGGIVCSRNLVWHKNMTLVQDTVAKSPYFREVRTIYMGLLLEAGDLPGAEEQYRIGSSLPSVRYDDRLDLKMAEILIRKGKTDEALEMYETIFNKSHGSSKAARNQIKLLLQNKVANTENPKLRMMHVRKLQKYAEIKDKRE